MSKKRVPTNKISGSGVKSTRSTVKSNIALKRHDFAGIALGGAKSDRTCVAFIEYFPEQNKIFLSELSDRLKTDGEVSSDLKLIDELTKARYDLNSIGINAPLSVPVCTGCKLKCPGYENCNEDEIQWMWRHYRKQVAKKKNHKLFTPYVERCAEHYVSTELEESFLPSQALGANMAPLWARANFLTRRLNVPVVEVMPKLSLWRIGRSLFMQKSHLRFHKHLVDGSNARLAIVKELVRREIAFLYEQDARMLVENVHAFDAFICAMTAMLRFRGQCEKKPKDFPDRGGWIEIPKADIIW